MADHDHDRDLIRTHEERMKAIESSVSGISGTMQTGFDRIEKAVNKSTGELKSDLTEWLKQLANEQREHGKTLSDHSNRIVAIETADKVRFEAKREMIKNMNGGNSRFSWIRYVPNGFWIALAAIALIIGLREGWGAIVSIATKIAGIL